MNKLIELIKTKYNSDQNGGGGENIANVFAAAANTTGNIAVNTTNALTTAVNTTGNIAVTTAVNTTGNIAANTNMTGNIISNITTANVGLILAGFVAHWLYANREWIYNNIYFSSIYRTITRTKNDREIADELFEKYKFNNYKEIKYKYYPLFSENYLRMLDTEKKMYEFIKDHYFDILIKNNLASSSFNNLKNDKKAIIINDLSIRFNKHIEKLFEQFCESTRCE